MTHSPTPTRSLPGYLVGKYGVQASATNQEVYLLVGTPHRAILPWARYCRIDPLGLNQKARWTDLLLATGLTGQLRKGQFSSHRSADQCTLNILPVTPGTGHDPVPGTPVRPVSTGQKAQKVQANQCLDQSELLVLNSSVRPVQLEQNVHESLGNMPSMQDEHTSKLSQAFQGLLNSDSPDDRDHRSHRADRAHRSHGSDLNRTRHRSDVSRSSRKDNSTHRAAFPLRHADPGEHSSASLLRHRRVRSRSRSYDSVSSRRHSRSLSRSRGTKKKSHKKRKYSSTSNSSYRSSSSSSSRERARNRHNSKRRNTLVHVHLNVTNVLRNTRGRGVLLHLLQFLHLLLLSREVRPGRSLELVLGHLLRLMNSS